MIDEHLQKKIREARTRANLSQVELAKLLNVCDQSVYHWETGRRAISNKIIEQIAEKTGQNIWWFYSPGGTDALALASDEEDVPVKKWRMKALEAFEAAVLSYRAKSDEGRDGGGLALPCAAVYHCDIVAFSSEVQPHFASF